MKLENFFNSTQCVKYIFQKLGKPKINLAEPMIKFQKNNQKFKIFYFYSNFILIVNFPQKIEINFHSNIMDGNFTIDATNILNSTAMGSLNNGMFDMKQNLSCQ